MKTSNLKVIGVLVGISVLCINFSCNRSEKGYDMNTESIGLDKTGETTSLNAIETERPQSIKRDHIDIQLKIIKNANCRIKAQSVTETLISVKQIISRYEGYISDERFSQTNYSKENRFTVRIPQKQFDLVLDSICELAEFVEYKNISTQDVTEEYIDISSRLKTKLEVKKRYEDILKTKAKTVKDVLLTEEKLRGLQEEIEAAQGRLNYLTNSVSYSTIQLDVYETVVPVEEPESYKEGFFQKAKEGMSFGWNILKHLFLSIFYIWPLILIGILIFVYMKWIRK